ncbi:C40 family peptidase [Streptacidiphilus monticola]|uniref:C40 family peptidase n=1 Tax=Streptacidiphilus monticola TaxID=2161674 RepID=A0ABW1GA97_9ACTN
MKRTIAGLALAVSLPIAQVAFPAGAVARPAHTVHSPGARIIAMGARYRGVPFVWGGNHPRTGFDCSGFTKYVFARLHVRIPRTAAAQFRAAHHTRHPKPGDLFFVHDASGHVYHVGIYVNRHTWLEAEHPGKGVGFYRPWTRHVWYGFFHVK